MAAKKHTLIGRYVLCRCASAGVHTGTLLSLNGDQAVLADSRRLWYWHGKGGIALSGVAQYGLENDSRLDTLNPLIALNGVIEVIPCSPEAEASIREYP